MIIFASEGATIRNQILSKLIKVSSQKWKVADCGGGLGGSYFEEALTAVIDIGDIKNSKNKNIKLYKGDINQDKVWAEIPDKHFDFIICTHTLEDIRDPLFVVKQLERVSKAGFISVPTRHTELSPIQSKFYNGYSHHRWIFTFNKNTFVGIFKWANFDLRLNLMDTIIITLYKLIAWLPTKRFKGAVFKKPIVNRKFYDKKLVTKGAGAKVWEIETSILWIDDISFEYFDNDGPLLARNSTELLERQNEFINLEFSNSSSNLDLALKKIFKN
jgi:hypothetical protein